MLTQDKKLYSYEEAESFMVNELRIGMPFATEQDLKKMVKIIYDLMKIHFKHFIH